MSVPFFTEVAETDIQEITQYIALDNAEAAHRVATAIEETAYLLAENPNLGVSARSNVHRDLRMFPISNYPNYLLFFQRENDVDVVIVRVFHGGRDVSSLLNT